MKQPWSGTAERAMPRHHNVALMRTSGTSMLFLSINRSTEEVCPWIHAGGIDVVVFGVFAHGVWYEGLVGFGVGLC